MSAVRCLITGCNFLDVEGRRWIHGDLHQLIDCLIFNANGCEWNDCDKTPLPTEENCVRCDHFYEKNSQIVFPLMLAQFNESANKYLNKTLDAEKKHIITFGDLH